MQQRDVTSKADRPQQPQADGRVAVLPLHSWHRQLRQCSIPVRGPQTDRTAGGQSSQRVSMFSSTGSWLSSPVAFISLLHKSLCCWGSQCCLLLCVCCVPVDACSLCRSWLLVMLHILYSARVEKTLTCASDHCAASLLHAGPSPHHQGQHAGFLDSLQQPDPALQWHSLSVTHILTQQT